MADKLEIANAIKSWISDVPNLWRIGITNNPAQRRKDWANDGENIEHWQQWLADSLVDAQEIERFFINEIGMKGGTGGDMSSRSAVYVYIF